MRNESATVTAVRLGLAWKRGGSTGTLTNDQLLDLAVSAYWKNRCARAAS